MAHTITPGPLFYDEMQGGSHIVHIAAGEIAEFFSDTVGDQQAKANALLFVSASDILAASERVLHWIDSGCDPSNKSVEALRAVIAKAKGLQS